MAFDGENRLFGNLDLRAHRQRSDPAGLGDAVQGRPAANEGQPKVALPIRAPAMKARRESGSTASGAPRPGLAESPQ
jgi:hypothetical protein